MQNQFQMNSKQASLSQIQWRQFLGKKAITLSGTESREMVEIKNAICNILQENEAMKNNMDGLKRDYSKAECYNSERLSIAK